MAQHASLRGNEKEAPQHCCGKKRRGCSLEQQTEPSWATLFSLQFNSIGYWSWVHVTQPWFGFQLTSSTVWFWQTECPSLQVNLKKNTYLLIMAVHRHRVAKKAVGKSGWRGLLHDHRGIYIRVSSINAEPSPTASSKTHPDTGWPSSYGNSWREQSCSLLLWVLAKSWKWDPIFWHLP